MMEKYLTNIVNHPNRKILWWGSLSMVFVLLFSLRSLVQAKQNAADKYQKLLIATQTKIETRHNVDLYIAAIQAQNLNQAMDILLHKPMEEAYLNRRITTKLSPKALSCGLESAVTVGTKKRDFSDGVGTYTLCNQFLTQGARPTESTLVAALDNSWPDVAVRCLVHGVKGEGVAGAVPPILTVTTMLIEQRYDTQYETDLYKSCLDLLLKHQVNLNHQDNKGNTALHLLVINHRNMQSAHYLNTLKEILHSNRGLQINAKNKIGQTALHIALANLEDRRYIETKKPPNTRVLAYLLEARANPHQMWISGLRSQMYAITKIEREDENLSLLEWAKKNTHQNVVALLEQYTTKN
jgi:hypothetical protein